MTADENDDLVPDQGPRLDRSPDAGVTSCSANESGGGPYFVASLRPLIVDGRDGDGQASRRGSSSSGISGVWPDKLDTQSSDRGHPGVVIPCH